jgi:glyoxylate carboligase
MRDFAGSGRLPRRDVVNIMGGDRCPRTKGADLITEYLIANKIPYVFGICGHGNVGMLDSLYAARDRITMISPRHEQVAAHMADAYFRVRHEPVATLTSCGPGSCNIVMPLACAISDSSALLAITANVPTSQFNRSPFQEINKHFQADFPNIIRPVVKRSFQPTRVDMLPLALRQAMTTMLSGRPGPVNLDVPFNVFQEDDDVELPPPAPPLNANRSGASPVEFSACIDLDCEGAAASNLYRPWRHAVGSFETAHRIRAQARHPGDLVTERHGLFRYDRPAGAWLHRAQRRLPCQ